MPRSYKINAYFIVILTIIFFVFFGLCKHFPALAQVATFTEDPYDSVAAVPLALFLAALTAIRAFRPYQPNGTLERQQAFLVRGAYLTCLAVAVTLGADVVAMLRYPSVWIGKPSGSLLVVLVAAMALLTAFVGWRIHATTREDIRTTKRSGWARALGISLVGACICALYPQNWRQDFSVGGWGTVFILFTIVVGMMIQYTSIWAWGMVIFPPKDPPCEDFMDDLAALYTLLKRHIGRLSVLLLPFEKALSSSLLRPVVSWINPRKGYWYGIALTGLLFGVVLAYAEAFGQGHLYPRLGLLRVYAGVECLAFLLGYAFFARSLGLARRTSTNIIHIKSQNT